MRETGSLYNVPTNYNFPPLRNGRRQFDQSSMDDGNFNMNRPSLDMNRRLSREDYQTPRRTMTISHGNSYLRKNSLRSEHNVLSDDEIRDKADFQYFSRPTDNSSFAQDIVQDSFSQDIVIPDAPISNQPTHIFPERGDEPYKTTEIVSIKENVWEIFDLKEAMNSLRIQILPFGDKLFVEFNNHDIILLKKLLTFECVRSTEKEIGNIASNRDSVKIDFSDGSNMIIRNCTTQIFSDAMMVLQKFMRENHLRKIQKTENENKSKEDKSKNKTRKSKSEPSRKISFWKRLKK